MPLLFWQVFQEATIEDRESSSEAMSATDADGAFRGASLGFTQGQPLGNHYRQMSMLPAVALSSGTRVWGIEVFVKHLTAADRISPRRASNSCSSSLRVAEKGAKSRRLLTLLELPKANSHGLTSRSKAPSRLQSVLI